MWISRVAFSFFSLQFCFSVSPTSFSLKFTRMRAAQGRQLGGRSLCAKGRHRLAEGKYLILRSVRKGKRGKKRIRMYFRKQNSPNTDPLLHLFPSAPALQPALSPTRMRTHARARTVRRTRAQTHARMRLTESRGPVELGGQSAGYGPGSARRLSRCRGRRAQLKSASHFPENGFVIPISQMWKQRPNMLRERKALGLAPGPSDPKARSLHLLGPTLSVGLST